MSKKNALIGGVLAVGAVLALIVLSSGGDDGDGSAAKTTTGAGRSGQDGTTGAKPTEAEASLPTIVVGKDGKPVGGVAELTYEKDDEVRFKVESAVADEVHVHGYDLMKEVGPGTAVSFDFPASLEGIFEAELEARGEQILELRVEP